MRASKTTSGGGGGGARAPAPARSDAPAAAVLDEAAQEEVIIDMLHDAARFRSHIRGTLSLVNGILLVSCAYLLASQLATPWADGATFFAPLRARGVRHGDVVLCMVQQVLGYALALWGTALRPATAPVHVAPLLFALSSLLLWGGIFALHSLWSAAHLLAFAWLALAPIGLLAVQAIADRSFAGIDDEVAALAALQYRAKTA